MAVMFSLIVPTASGFLLFCFWMWAVFDVISMDSILVRNLPKSTWVFLVLFLPMIGSVAWLLLGRPEGAGMSVGGRKQLPYPVRPRAEGPRYLGPDDDPGFAGVTSPSRPDRYDEDSIAIRERKLLEKEAELAKREAALSDETALGDEPDDDQPTD